VNRESPCTTDNLRQQLTAIASGHSNIHSRHKYYNCAESRRRYKKANRPETPAADSAAHRQGTFGTCTQTNHTCACAIRCNTPLWFHGHHWVQAKLSLPHSKNLAGALRVLAALAAAGPRPPAPSTQIPCTHWSPVLHPERCFRSTVRAPNIPPNLHSGLNPRTSCTLGWCVSHPIGAYLPCAYGKACHSAALSHRRHMTMFAGARGLAVLTSMPTTCSSAGNDVKHKPAVMIGAAVTWTNYTPASVLHASEL
jgi:hypothetical protein